MKTIFNDPIHWAEKAAGTSMRFWSLSFFQAVIGCAVVIGSLKTGNTWVGMLAILVALTWPLSYLYVLRQLLAKLKQHELR